MKPDPIEIGDTLTAWCDGKEIFTSASLARKIASASSARHDTPIMAYKCPDCGFWHTGTSARRGKRKMRVIRR